MQEEDMPMLLKYYQSSVAYKEYKGKRLSGVDQLNKDHFLSQTFITILNRRLNEIES